MTTTAGISLHVDPTQISHHYHPGDAHSDGYGTLDLGKPGYDAYMYVFFKTTAAIDTAIAELVALKQEMDPPVITEPAPQEHAYVTPAMAERRDKAAAEYADAGCYDITGRTA
jgi:hypothetical protein